MCSNTASPQRNAEPVVEAEYGGPVIRRRAAAVVLVLLGVLWILVNQPYEGPTLVRLSYNHSITTADLLSVAAFAVAVALWFGRPHRRRTRRQVADERVARR